MGQLENPRALPPPERPAVVPGSSPEPLHEPLPEMLTWSATIDPQDETLEVEITDEMIRLAIAQIEREQVYPFESTTRRRGTVPVAHPVRKADVLPFPGPSRQVS